MIRRTAGVLVCLTLAPTARVLAGDNWPQWRGPAFDGTSDSINLPVSWSETKNVRWKTPLPSFGAATPAVWGDRIFVLSGSPAGAGGQAANRRGARSEHEGLDLFLLCLSRKDGSVSWRRKLDEGNIHFAKQNMASPSPVTDGKHVWAMTGTGVLTALDMDGNIIWHRELQKDYGPLGLDYGYASSPLLLDRRVIVQVLQSKDDKNTAFLAAFDTETGQPVWKVDRLTDAIDECLQAYTSPTLMRYPDRIELIVAGGDYVTAHDPGTGKEIWRCGGLNPGRNPKYRAVCSPLAVDGMVFMSARQGPLVACRGGGRGDVTATHLAWTSPAATDVPTPVCDGKFLYVINDMGVFSCLDPRTGKAYYLKERLPGGAYSASPLLADGKVYVINENARTTVLAAGAQFKILSENQLDDGHTLSSIAVADRELFIRTGKYLYCISEAAK
jgi:outer membrane protein assembly factor BamB